jgi:hypothetical protein
MITITSQAANSIALRNAILAVIPQQVTRKVYNEALKKITGDLSDETKLIAKRTRVFKAMMESYKITEREILSVINREVIDHVDANDIATLIAIGQAIKDGDTTVQEAFRPGTMNRQGSLPIAQKYAQEREREAFMNSIMNFTLSELQRQYEMFQADPPNNPLLVEALELMIFEKESEHES